MNNDDLMWIVETVANMSIHAHKLAERKVRSQQKNRHPDCVFLVMMTRTRKGTRRTRGVMGGKIRKRYRKWRQNWSCKGSKGTRHNENTSHGLFILPAWVSVCVGVFVCVCVCVLHHTFYIYSSIYFIIYSRMTRGEEGTGTMRVNKWVG